MESTFVDYNRRKFLGGAAASAASVALANPAAEPGARFAFSIARPVSHPRLRRPRQPDRSRSHPPDR